MTGTELLSTKDAGNGLHLCAMADVQGCARKIPHRLLMCPMHWRMVPKPTQTALWNVYRRADEEGRAKITKAYLAAVAQCVNAVAERLKLPGRVVFEV